MELIINFHEKCGSFDVKLKSHTTDTIKIISNIIAGDFELYHALPKVGNNETENNINSILEMYIGLYYDKILGDYELAEKYYLMAIGTNVLCPLTMGFSAMGFLAKLYVKQQKYDFAKKYYSILANNGNIGATLFLADFYANQQKYHLSEKRYIKTINKLMSMNEQREDDTTKICIAVLANELAFLYHTQQKYDLAEKYYLFIIDISERFAIDNASIGYKKQQKYYLLAINNLAYIYKNQQRYDLAEKYYLMSIDNGYSSAIDHLKYAFNDDIKYFLCLKKINSSDPIIAKLIKQKLDQLMTNNSVYCFANKLI